MTLKPLGLKDSLIRPTSLGHNFKPLRTLSPLCQSFTPLGQSLQPLANSVIQPLQEVNEDWEIGNWQLDAGMQVGEDGGNFAGEIPQFSDGQLPIITRTNFNSNAGETTTPQEFVGESITNYRSEKEPLPPNPAALNNASAATNNIAQLKPLGFSKPLVEESACDISSLSDLPQFTQRPSTSSYENRVANSGETSSFSNSMPADTVDISNNVSPTISATPVNNISDSASLELPHIGRFNASSLGFNNQLNSQFITEPLPQAQTRVSAKLNLHTEKSPASSTTNKGEVDAIEPSSPNLIPAKYEPELYQKIGLLEPELIGEQTEGLTAKTDGEEGAVAPTSPNLIQSKNSPELSQETGTIQLELIGEETESLTPQTEREGEAVAPTSPNLIQAKTCPELSPETGTIQPELIGEETESLTPQTEGELEAIEP
ncbi:hypothetical protein QUB63_35130, partial [Microcoleus sp. ARI1-B5]